MSGVTGATYWEVSGRALGVLPAIGFTHVTFIDCEGDAANTEQLLQALSVPHDGNGGGLHSLMDAEILGPAGRWRRPRPSEESTGHVIAFAGPNDRLRQDEWDDWYDDVHIPDMMATGIFRGASRWVRQWSRFGPTSFVIFDIAGVDVDEAVIKTRTAMALAEENDRFPAFHAGGLRAWLRPVGRSTR